MDPKECLRLMLDASRADGSEEMGEHALNLLRWLQRGGYAPNVDREALMTIANAFVVLAGYRNGSFNSGTEGRG